MGAGDGVLFYDAECDGKISDRREYVFTDWAPGAEEDRKALRRAFDSNGDGVFSSADAKWSSFKVEVTRSERRSANNKEGQNTQAAYLRLDRDELWVIGG